MSEIPNHKRNIIFWDIMNALVADKISFIVCFMTDLT